MSEATQEAILPASERTQTVHVITREVAANKDGKSFKEVENEVAVFVRPLPFRRWPIALGHIANLFQFMPENGFDITNDAQLAVWVTNLLGNAGDDLFAIIELATGKEPAFFDMLDADDGLKIALAVIEVNKDFFVQKVMPLITEKLAVVKELLPETPGLTQ